MACRRYRSATTRSAADFCGQPSSSARPTAAWYSLILPLVLGARLSRLPLKPKFSAWPMRAIRDASVQATAPPSPVARPLVACRLKTTGISLKAPRLAWLAGSRLAAPSMTTGMPVRASNSSQGAGSTSRPYGATGIATPTWCRRGCAASATGSSCQSSARTSASSGS